MRTLAWRWLGLGAVPDAIRRKPFVAHRCGGCGHVFAAHRVKEVKVHELDTEEQNRVAWTDFFCGGCCRKMGF